MKHNYRTTKAIYILGILIAFSMISCTSSKKLTYFNDLPDSTIINLPPISQDERIVNEGDQLNISISAKDKEAASYFIKTGGVSTSSPSENATSMSRGGGESTYLVDNNGYIEFPIIGKVRVVGLTASQLKENLTKSVNPYLKEPLIDVNFVTFRATVLGEVRTPGTFVLPSQRTSLFEVLAAAGDLSPKAKMHNIQIYRDYSGQRKITKFDIRNKDVLNNPDVFFMKHNDVLYVQSRSGTKFQENFRIYTSVASVILSIITLGFTISNN